MLPYSESSFPGRELCICETAVLTRLTQFAWLCSTQVCMTSAKPTSFPPAVTLTSVVDEARAPSWPLDTLVVVAPEQATNLNEDGAFAAAQRDGYALVLRLQSPLSEV